MDNRAAGCVCVVDDEPKIRAVLRKTLERAGLTVNCFEGADDCLARLNTTQWDLLITDVRMPEKDGIELLMAVRRLQPWLPVLVVTGYGDVTMAVKALKAGAADFLEKPLEKDSFLETVRTLLACNTAERVLLDHALTRMEMKVLYHILDGKNNREIADVLNRSPRTVEVHRRHLMRKAGANNVVELLRQAAKLHLFDPDASVAGAHHVTDGRVETPVALPIPPSPPVQAVEYR